MQPAFLSLYYTPSLGIISFEKKREKNVAYLCEIDDELV